MAKKYIIVPSQGFDDVRFSELRDSVRAKNGSFSEFKKNQFSQNTTDDFGDWHAYYDQSNRLEAVEFYDGEVYLNQDKLFPLTKDAFCSLLNRYDESTCSYEGYVVSNMLGIRAFAPSEIVETVLVHREGYYD